MTTKLPAANPDDQRRGERRQTDRRDTDQPLVLEWSEKFSTGIRVIDNDHRGLFEEVAILNEQFSMRPQPRNLEWIIESLQRYVAEHFVREEKFMEDAHYPHLEAHKKQHRRAEKLIQELGHIHAADPESIDGKKVVNFLTGWLTGHILGSDMKYVPYLKGATEAQPEEPETVSDGGSDHVEQVTLTLKLSPEQAEAVEKFAGTLADGGRVAAALIEAIDQIFSRRSNEVHNSAVKTFCRD